MQQAFVSIDFMQEFRSTLDGDDSLALRVAAGLMSSKEAAAQARRANAIVSETEKPLRVILALLEKLNLTDINLIVKDTVF